VTDVLTPIETRLDAILKGGRGADGALGADALARSIPADRYRRSTDGASLRDFAYPINGFDRAYSYEWGAIEPAEENANQACSRMLVRVSLELLLGHLYGAEHARMIRTVGSEVAATVALRPRVRLVGDVLRISRALCLGTLFGNDTDPVIVNVMPAGATSTEDLGDRLLTTVPFSVVLNVSQTSAYTP